MASSTALLMDLMTNLGITRLINEALNVPLWEYAVFGGLIMVFFLYHALDFHFVGDLITGLRGDKVKLVFSPVSRICEEILPKCPSLNHRYWPTIWLCSPHLQTAFVHFHGRPPKVQYRRELFYAPDGGTSALDWLDPEKLENTVLEEAPIVIIVPGLSSESHNAYMKHLAYGMTTKGWRAVVINHRGLGGVTVTSERFYHAGWTNDLRWFIDDLHQKFPKALLLAVGTSLGANILVKYLGEEGENTPLSAATSICNPWDLLVCDRFISRKPVQKLYDIAIATGLTDMIMRHSNILSSMDNWKFIVKSRSIRAFDHLFTITVGKFETVDDYYRRTSSARFLGSVAVPLLAVNSLDDPLCTKEAIPWDECRVNPNLLLAVTRHGGHLAYFEGLTAKNIWWVRAIQDFFSAFISSSLLRVVKEEMTDALPRSPASVTEEQPGEQVAEEVASEEEEPQCETQCESTQTSTAQMEPSVFMDEKGLNIQLCLKTRSEMVALQRALSKILEEESSHGVVEEQKAAASSVLGNKTALLLIAVPLVGSALALGLRRKGFRRIFRNLMY